MRILYHYCMEIIKNLNGSELTIKLVGELNTITSPFLEDVIKNDLNGIKSLIFDFSQLDYLSSSGLRTILVAQKIMDNQGKMVIKKPNDSILEIFDITGFSSLLEIEN